jgi:hypothetical protein
VSIVACVTMLLITLLDDNEVKAAQYCCVAKERNNVVLVHCCSSANVTEPREPHTCNIMIAYPAKEVTYFAINCIF